MTLVRKRAKSSVNVWRFVQENDAAIRQPSVIGLPGLCLSHYFVDAHHCLCGKKPEETELCKVAKANARFHVQFFEPRFGDAVVNVASIGQGDPHVYIREKE